MTEPTSKQKRILSFFRRTEGITTLAPVYARAIEAFPSLDPESAITEYWKQALEAERRDAESGVNDTATKEDYEAICHFVNLQFV